MTIENLNKANKLRDGMEFYDDILRSIWEYEDYEFALCSETDSGTKKIAVLPQSLIKLIKNYYSDEIAKLKKEFDMI